MNSPKQPETTAPYIGAACRGEFCSLCGMEAAAKIGEEIARDDPNPNRHNRTAYVCSNHFFDLMGQWP